MKLIGILTAALIISLPTWAQAAPPEPSDKCGGDHMRAHEIKYPLTDEQRHKLAALRDQFELDTAQDAAQLRVSEHQLRRIIFAVNADKPAALGLQSKINSLRNSLSQSKLNLMLASNDVFTTEQKEEMKTMRRHHPPFDAHHRGFGPPECGPGHRHPGGAQFFSEVGPPPPEAAMFGPPPDMAMFGPPDLGGPEMGPPPPEELVPPLL